MATKREKIIINLLMIFLILQPIFDVLSNLANYNYVGFNFITYLKPLFVIFMYIYLFFSHKYKGKFKQVIFFFLVCLYIVAHSVILKIIYVENSVIIHEVRFLINIIYFIILFLVLKNMASVCSDKEEYEKKIKKALMITIALYIILYIIAVVTGTSWLTYEFSDSSKLGFRGWNYSGQIMGHLLCISLPICLYYVYNFKINSLFKLSIILVSTIPFLLIGTKAPYFILLLVNIFYILVIIFYKIIHRDYKINKISIGISLIIIILSIGLYNYIPVRNNILINNSVSGSVSQEEDLDAYISLMKNHSEKNKEKINNNNNNSDSQNKNDLKFIISDKNREKLTMNYEEWTLKSLDKLNELYAKGKLHSSDNRNRQLVFLQYKFMYSSISFKLLGLGYLNQPNELSIERDIIMPLYCFGIIGFILFTSLFWWLLGKSIFMGLTKFKKINLETIFLIEGFCMFFFISFFVGYTYIYTQFANILAVIMCLLYIELSKLKEEKK